MHKWSKYNIFLNSDKYTNNNNNKKNSWFWDFYLQPNRIKETQFNDQKQKWKGKK